MAKNDPISSTEKIPNTFLNHIVCTKYFFLKDKSHQKQLKKQVSVHDTWQPTAASSNRCFRLWLRGEHAWVGSARGEVWLDDAAIDAVEDEVDVVQEVDGTASAHRVVAKAVPVASTKPRIFQDTLATPLRQILSNDRYQVRIHPKIFSL